MKWISYPVTFVLSVFCFIACNRKIEPEEGKRPNVVIIFIDDLGYGDLSCYGNTLIQTPHIDRLAEMGSRFTNFYVNSPICSPSRVALNTGCYPMRFAIHSFIAGSRRNRERAMADYLDPGVVTLAGVLKKNGYSTGHFGKWHMGGGRDLGNVPLPSAYGFEKTLVSFEGIGDRVLFPGDQLCEQSAELGRGHIIWAEKHRSTGIYVDSALSFVRRLGDQPFYINLCPNDVHDPHLPTEADQRIFSSVSENPYEQKFLAVLNELDKQIGRFMEGLDQLGALENTIIIFTSDNGPTDWPLYYDPAEYPDHYSGRLYPPGSTGGYFGRKWSLFEGGIRMPFIVVWKDHIPAGNMDTTSVVAAMDIFPSVCSMLKIGCPDHLDGTDKSRALLGTPAGESAPIMWEYSSNPGGSILPGNAEFISPNLAIRDGDWKLLINVDSTDARLFNLKKDPDEKNNLVEINEDRAAELAHRVIAWRSSMPVPLPD